MNLAGCYLCFHTPWSDWPNLTGEGGACHANTALNINSGGQWVMYLLKSKEIPWSGLYTMIQCVYDDPVYQKLRPHISFGVFFSCLVCISWFWGQFSPPSRDPLVIIPCRVNTPCEETKKLCHSQAQFELLLTAGYNGLFRLSSFSELT